MRISDWSSDVCSSDLRVDLLERLRGYEHASSRVNTGLPGRRTSTTSRQPRSTCWSMVTRLWTLAVSWRVSPKRTSPPALSRAHSSSPLASSSATATGGRSEEHTSELQSLMRHPFAALFFTKKKLHNTQSTTTH